MGPKSPIYINKYSQSQPTFL